MKFLKPLEVKPRPKIGCWYWQYPIKRMGKKDLFRMIRIMEWLLPRIWVWPWGKLVISRAVDDGLELQASFFLMSKNQATHGMSRVQTRMIFHTISRQTPCHTTLDEQNTQNTTIPHFCGQRHFFLASISPLLRFCRCFIVWSHCSAL